MALLPPDPATDRTLTLMRLGVLPLFVVAGLSLYWGAARRFGKPAAILATALFTMTPTVLAHAGLATTDIALVACLGGAFFALLSWAEAPGWKSAAILGLWTALAVLSKFTTLAYLPASAGFALLFYVLVRKPGVRELAALARARWTTFTIAVAGGGGRYLGGIFLFVRAGTRLEHQPARARIIRWRARCSCAQCPRASVVSPRKNFDDGLVVLFSGRACGEDATAGSVVDHPR